MTRDSSSAPSAEVTKVLRIAARPETVWRYWTEPERMAEWWGTVARLDPRPGGACRVDMGGGVQEAGEEDGPVMSGEFLEVVPFERLVFSFGWEPSHHTPDIPPGSTRVEVTFEADGDDTVLTVHHSGLPVALGEIHRAGWEHHLPRLAAAAGTIP
jgi:uncharacterized protein YndB with AHSA1/START domain